MYVQEKTVHIGFGTTQFHTSTGGLRAHPLLIRHDYCTATVKLCRHLKEWGSSNTRKHTNVLCTKISLLSPILTALFKTAPSLWHYQYSYLLSNFFFCFLSHFWKNITANLEFYDQKQYLSKTKSSMFSDK